MNNQNKGTQSGSNVRGGSSAQQSENASKSKDKQNIPAGSKPGVKSDKKDW